MSDGAPDVSAEYARQRRRAACGWLLPVTLVYGSLFVATRTPCWTTRVACAALVLLSMAWSLIVLSRALACPRCKGDPWPKVDVRSAWFRRAGPPATCAKCGALLLPAKERAAIDRELHRATLLSTGARVLCGVGATYLVGSWILFAPQRAAARYPPIFDDAFAIVAVAMLVFFVVAAATGLPRRWFGARDR